MLRTAGFSCQKEIIPSDCGDGFTVVGAMFLSGADIPAVNIFAPQESDQPRHSAQTAETNGKSYSSQPVLQKTESAETGKNIFRLTFPDVLTVLHDTGYTVSGIFLTVIGIFAVFSEKMSVKKMPAHSLPVSEKFRVECHFRHLLQNYGVR